MKKWKKIHIVAWLCLAAIVPAVVVGIIIDMDGETAGTMLGLLFLSWFVLLIVSFIVRLDDPDVKAKREMKAKKIREDLEKQKEWKEKCKSWEKERKQKARQQNIPDWPVSAVIVTTQDKTKNKSGLGSAVVGGMIAGPIGAVVGASVGKKTVVTGQKVTFSVKYRSGRTDIETVEVGTERFKTLSSLLLQ